MENMVQAILADIDGAITYIIDGKDDHPNRIDILKEFAPQRGGRGGRGARGTGPRVNFSNRDQSSNSFQTQQQQQQPTGFGQQPTAGFGQPAGFGVQPSGFGVQQDDMMMSPTVEQGPGFGMPVQNTGYGTNNGFGAQPANNGFGVGFGGEVQQQTGGFGNMPQQQPASGFGLPQQNGGGFGVSQNGGGFNAPVGTIPGEASMEEAPMAMFGLDEQQYQQAYEQAKLQGTFPDGLNMPFMAPKSSW